jgi:hypothetical protein
MKRETRNARPVPVENRHRHCLLFYMVGAWYYSNRLNRSGEPFPLVWRCLFAGMDPRSLYMTARDAWRDITM